VSYHDPHCPVILDDGHTPLQGLPLGSQPWSRQLLREADAVVIVTDHAGVDYQAVADEAHLVIDARGVMRRFAGAARVVGLSSGDAPAGSRAAVA
jgi:UDP-N-acetyl-D-glucosamine dehydrogenase